MDLGRISFEDPWALLVGLVALLPLAVALLSVLRSRSVARTLGLTPDPSYPVLATAAAVAACLLLAVAAARPVLHEGEREVRADSEVVFVVDISRSMLARPSPGSPTRLDRARDAVLRLRSAVPDVPAGVAGLTDRVLPYSFPSPDRAAFADVVARSVAVESPPPRLAGGAIVVTSFEALAELRPSFFTEGVGRRACVVVTDGESRSFTTGPDGRACEFFLIRVGSGDERIYGESGRPEPGYRPDPSAEASLDRLAASTGGRVWPISRLDDAARALRSSIGVGPTRRIAASDEQLSLAAYPAGLALALTVLLALRAVRRPRLGSSARTVWALLAVALAALSLPTAAAAAAGDDWRLFGRTPDNLRHSPLRELAPRNVGELRRAYTIDFQTLDPDVRRGQQSYPLAIGGRLFVTTNDGNVFAIQARTGRVLWQYKPRDSALFENFGIVANRGLAFCEGRLFLAQLDMKLVALRPRDGRVLATTSIAEDVPNALPNYGYSETSAPVCADGRVVIGAAGSEYGIRGFVMAYTPDLRPAWPSPFWTIPPDRQSWRRLSRIVGGGAVWTPVTIDVTSRTVYFGTGASTPHFVSSIRPGPNPRTNALVAVDLRNGRLKWWRELIAGNEWGYDVAQPPMVYTRELDGTPRRIVSVATMEGVWFAFDASTGEPLQERVRVIDRVEHPRLEPGRAVRVFPATLGGVNYSPGSFDPATGYVFNAAAETAVVMKQQALTDEGRRRKLLLGDVFLGLENGDFGQALPGWRDHGSISAIDVATGQRVWKLRVPEPERGGVTTTATGLGFSGGGDGLLRAFDLRTGRVLWRFDTGDPIASGVTVFSAGGRQHLAVTVGGTPTSSDGGTVSKLMVFRLGAPSAARPPTAVHPVTTERPPREPVPRAGAVPDVDGRLSIDGGAVALGVWRPSSSNLVTVTGRVRLRGQPVTGVRVRVGRYDVPTPTDAEGRFRVAVDSTLARRLPVQVTSAAGSRVDGRAVTTRERRRLEAMRSGVNVGYRLAELEAKEDAEGRIVVRGRALRADGAPAPPVTLLSYRLSGRITDAAGRPVENATVVTRTLDRNYWTLSAPSDANGRYTGFFPASDELGSDPVPMSVQVARGKTSYSSGFDRNVTFDRLRSAVMNVGLSGAPDALPIPGARSEPGAIYRGLLIGVSGPGGIVTPIRAQWPDAQGRFELVLPAAVKGQRLRFWQDETELFARSASPEGDVAVSAWPSALDPDVPRDIATLGVPD
ncbi:MAG TPA: PQQ-binding-like beta-propeller repeat protein [Gaiella sp.]|nr:PQQ-binding-like beta-propeller repeat protein [Gaiella sp.]